MSEVFVYVDRSDNVEVVPTTQGPTGDRAFRIGSVVVYLPMDAAIRLRDLLVAELGGDR